MAETKDCLRCNQVIVRRANEGPKAWGLRRYCSKRCAGARPMPEQKACARCSVIKAVSGFKTLASGRPGPYCRSCESLKQSEYYHCNLEQRRKKKSEWMSLARRDPGRKQTILESQRRAYANGGRLRQRERIKKLQQDRPFRWKAILVRRWSRETTESDLRNLWENQQGLCAITGRPMDPRTAEIDHIVPRSRGGGNGISNMRWVCKEANALKGNLTDEELLSLCNEVAEWIGRRIVAAA